MHWRENIYQRDKLYDEVWAEPVSRVAKRYGISGVALAKVCRKLAVPLPLRGHWTLVELKKAGPRPPLPPFHGRAVIYSEIRVLEESVREEIDRILTNEMNFSTLTSVPVAEALHKPHPLVDRTRTDLKGLKPGNYAVLGGRRGSLDISVSLACAGRALRIYDALIKAMESLGWIVKVGGRDENKTYVVIRGEEIPFAIEERTKQVDHVLTSDEERTRARWPDSFVHRWDYQPTGELSLRIKEYGGDGIRKNCSDTKQLRLEERLAEFLEIIRRFAAHELMERRQRECEAQKRAAEQARLVELRAQQEAEKRRIQEVEMEADAWHKAEHIRTFVKAALQAGARDQVWANWAMEYADQLDPIRTS
ncbi:MAG: hypothetical protein Q7T05_06195 [Dehalococcoidia bacterium]|nr:hypothetical protein [Dehalococcoidia bacterium]